jgi:hypothetical protein
MSLFRTVAIAAGGAALVVLGGCGGPRLAADPPAGVELHGTWRLDPAASDDARAIVAAALPKPRHGGGPDAGAMVRSFVLPAEVLRIGGTEREIVFSQDGRRRAFTPGDDTPYSVTDRYGTRRVHAGWERSEFVIVSRDPRGVEIVERFRRGAAPDTLVSTVILEAPGIDDVRVSSLYRRSTTEPPPSRADDGPPAPLR